MSISDLAFNRIEKWVEWHSENSNLEGVDVSEYNKGYNHAVMNVRNILREVGYTDTCREQELRIVELEQKINEALDAFEDGEFMMTCDLCGKVDGECEFIEVMINSQDLINICYGCHEK